MSLCYFFFLTFPAANVNGSSSPSTGGFPLPTRARIRLTLAGSARPSAHTAETSFDGREHTESTLQLCYGMA